MKFQAGGFRPFSRARVSTLQNQIVPARRVFGRGGDALQIEWAASAWAVNKMIDAADTFFRARVPKPDPRGASQRISFGESWMTVRSKQWTT